jgi:hypothetical protein
MNEIEEEYYAIRIRLRAAEELAALQLAALQARCPHTRTRYQPDASGNNDDSTWCLDCHKDL